MAQNQEGCQHREIMVCVDESPFSEEAYYFYCNNVRREEDRVTIIRVASLHPPALPGAMIDPQWRKIIEEHEENIKKFEEKWKKIIGEAGEVLVLGQGYSIGDTICKASKKKNINMIICAQRGMGILRRTVMGSVSDYLLHHAHCPVLVVPKHHGDKEIHEQQQH